MVTATYISDNEEILRRSNSRIIWPLLLIIDQIIISAMLFIFLKAILNKYFRSTEAYLVESNNINWLA